MDILKTLKTIIAETPPQVIFDLIEKPLKDLITDIKKEFNTPTQEQPDTKQESSQETSKESVEELIKNYSNLVDQTFIHHKNGKSYLLIDILNKLSEDQNKFPTSVVYLDLQLKTKWCRPLVEFHSNFIKENN